MRKSFLLLLMLVLSVGWMKAETEIAHKLKLELKDGSVSEFLFSDDPQITFSGNIVNVKAAQTQISVDYTMINQFYTEAYELVGLQKISADSNKMRVEFVGPYEVCITGACNADVISVQSLNGKRVQAQINAQPGEIRIDLSNQPAGAYLISLPNHQTIKIMK